ERLVRLDEAVSRPRVAKRQHAVDENSERAGAGKLERALQVLAALHSQPADDAPPQLGEATDLERDEAAAPGRAGPQAAARRETGERTRPERRLADVLEDHVDTAVCRDPHDLPLEIVRSVVHTELGTE